MVPLAIGLVLIVFAVLPLRWFGGASVLRRVAVAMGVAASTGVLAWALVSFNIGAPVRMLLILPVLLLLIPSFRRFFSGNSIQV
jgi:hypothetical protein